MIRLLVFVLALAACTNDSIPKETITAPLPPVPSARQDWVPNATGSFQPAPEDGYPLSPACTTVQGAANKPNWGLHTSLPVAYGGSLPYVASGSGSVDDGRITYQWGGSHGTRPLAWSPLVIRTLSWATPGLYDLPVTLVDGAGDTLETSVVVSIPPPDYSGMEAESDWTRVAPAQEVLMPPLFVAHCKFFVVDKGDRVHISNGWAMGRRWLVTTGGSANVRFVEESGVIQGPEGNSHGRFQTSNPAEHPDPHIDISVPPVAGLIDLRLNVTDGTQTSPFDLRIWVY